MASMRDHNTRAGHLTYAKSNVPLVGALIDYLETSLEYLRRKTFARAERLHVKATKASLSSTFVATVCLLLGLVCNVKFEVATFEEEPLPNDLHFILMSKDDNLYIDDIDVSRVMWCIEASDALVILISALLIWNSVHVRSPLSEYLFLPWLGATLRGLFLRQAPTAGALIYTMAVINGNVNPLFLTAFSFLFRTNQTSPNSMGLCRFIAEFQWPPSSSSFRLAPYYQCIVTHAEFQLNDTGKWVKFILQDLMTIIGTVLEARLWLEIARLVRMRWERRENLELPPTSQYEVQTLWSNDDAQSVEVGNFVY